MLFMLYGFCGSYIFAGKYPYECITFLLDYLSVVARELIWGTVPIHFCLHILIFIDKNYFCVCFWPSSHSNLSDTVQVHNILIRFEPLHICRR